MEIKVIADNLIMEVTRKCNMHCAMCLRGDAEDATMPDSVIDATFQALDEVSRITPSGGEPFLAPDATVKVLRKARNKEANSAFLSTNGTIPPFSAEGFPVVQEMMNYAPGYITSADDCEPFIDCTIQVSRDDFHDESRGNYPSWNMLRFVSFRSGAENSIIARGLADRNGLGNNFRKERAISLSLEFIEETLYVTVAQLYVNVFGECFADCDLSYAQQDEPVDWLIDGCHLGHISNLRKTLLGCLKEDCPELFAAGEKIAEAVSA